MVRGDFIALGAGCFMFTGGFASVRSSRPNLPRSGWPGFVAVWITRSQSERYRRT